MGSAKDENALQKQKETVTVCEITTLNLLKCCSFESLTFKYFIRQPMQ